MYLKLFISFFPCVASQSSSGHLPPVPVNGCRLLISLPRFLRFIVRLFYQFNCSLNSTEKKGSKKTPQAVHLYHKPMLTAARTPALAPIATALAVTIAAAVAAAM